MPLDLEKVQEKVREALDLAQSIEGWFVEMGEGVLPVSDADSYVLARILEELERDITTELLTTPIRGVALQTDPGDT